MAKKDFSLDSSSVFNAFFSNPIEQNSKDETNKTEKKLEVKEVKVSTPKVEKKEVKSKIEVKEKTSPVAKAEKNNVIQSTDKKQKIFENKYRYSFYADPILNEYVSNVNWIKRNKNTATYINQLIRQDFINTLGINENATDEEIISAWEQYKIDNNI